MSKRPRGTGSIFSVPGSRNLWVGYTGANDEYIRESERTWNAHLRDYFGGETLKAEKKTEKYSGMKATRVGTVQLAGYVEKRQGEGASKSQSTANWLCFAGLSRLALILSRKRFPVCRNSIASL